MTGIGQRNEERHARQTGESGQALLELALIVPILIVLVMAIFQFAYVFESQMGLTNAVREAARRAAANPDETPTWYGGLGMEGYVQSELCGDLTAPCDSGLLEQNVSAFDPGRLTGDLPVVTFCTYPVVGSSGTITNYQVNVSLTYEHPLFFGPLAFAIDGDGNGAWELSASAQMRMEFVDPTVFGFDPSVTDVCP